MLQMNEWKERKDIIYNFENVCNTPPYRLFRYKKLFTNSDRH